MNGAIAPFEEALREWRNAQTRVEALKMFQANGGDFRLRMTTDSGDPIIGGIMDDLMQGNGYATFLRSAINFAEARAAKAQANFHALSTMHQEIPETVKAALRSVDGDRR